MLLMYSESESIRPTTAIGTCRQAGGRAAVKRHLGGPPAHRRPQLQAGYGSGAIDPRQGTAGYGSGIDTINPRQQQQACGGPVGTQQGPPAQPPPRRGSTAAQACLEDRLEQGADGVEAALGRGVQLPAGQQGPEPACLLQLAQFWVRLSCVRATLGGAERQDGQGCVGACLGPAGCWLHHLVLEGSIEEAAARVGGGGYVLPEAVTQPPLYRPTCTTVTAALTSANGLLPEHPISKAWEARARPFQARTPTHTSLLLLGVDETTLERQ